MTLLRSSFYRRPGLVSPLQKTFEWVYLYKWSVKGLLSIDGVPPRIIFKYFPFVEKFSSHYSLIFQAI